MGRNFHSHLNLSSSKRAKTKNTLSMKVNELRIKPMRCEIICIRKKSTRSCCLHHLFFSRIQSSSLYSFLCKLILSRFETCKQYQKPQCIALKNHKTFFFSFHFHQRTKEVKCVFWRVEKVQERKNIFGGAKKSIFMSSYIFYETAVCCLL